MERFKAFTALIVKKKMEREAHVAAWTRYVFVKLALSYSVSIILLLMFIHYLICK